MNAMITTVRPRTSFTQGGAVHSYTQRVDESALPFGFPSFQRVLESCACPILIISASSRAQSIVYASPAFLTLSGYSAAEVLGREWTRLFERGASDSWPQMLQAAISGGSEVQGLLTAKHRTGSTLYLDAKLTPLRSDVGLVTHYVAALHDLTAERRRREDLEFQAYHDPLTGLANRHLLRDRFEVAISHARRHGTSFAIALLDLNGFKQVNDHYGHDAGDMLLRSVGVRLTKVIRHEDTVARLGGDEFALLLTDSGKLDAAECVMDRAHESLGEPVQLEDGVVRVSCCAGIARYPHDGTDLERLLKAADVRLYNLKAAFNSRKGC
jgi:diguanylate cyclase (GGDEF)-like protein/PAS domain S-box-containing protein